MIHSLAMKTYSCFTSSLALALLVPFLNQAAAVASPKDSSPKTPARPQPQCVPEVAIPQSVFVTGEGRNPFFPQSTTRVIVPKVNKENPIESFTFVLNGITSPPKRTAMINGRTFEPGEEGEVKLPTGGRMLIKVEEIKAESAIILVAGQRRELKLRSGV
jgi:hypothetical protein